MNKFLILALLFSACLCIHDKLRKQSAPPFEQFSDEDECKIQRCIDSEMASNWKSLYKQEECKNRQIQCFKTCHIKCCEKKNGKGSLKCSRDQFGKEYPADYSYEPPTEAFENHKNEPRAMEYLNNRNK